MNVTETVSYAFSNETYGFEVFNWIARNERGDFNNLEVYGESENFTFDVCVTGHPLHGGNVSTIPTGFRVNQHVGDPTGYSLAPSWAELGRYSFTTERACFTGTADMRAMDSAQSLLPYLGRYSVVFPSHESSSLPLITWWGIDVVPGDCRIYDIALTRVLNRQLEVTAFYSCRGGANAFLWDYLFDNTVSFEDKTFWDVPDLNNEEGSEVYLVYIYPPEEADLYALNCQGDDACLKLQKPVGSSVLIDLRTAFLDQDGDVFPGTEYSESFKVFVGEDSNSAEETGVYFGGNVVSGLVAFALDNPLGFLLGILMIAIFAPLLLYMIFGGGRRD